MYKLEHLLDLSLSQKNNLKINTRNNSTTRMNYTFNGTNHKLDADPIPLDHRIEDLKRCLIMVTENRTTKTVSIDSGLSDASFAGNIKEAILDPVHEITTAAFGFMGQMFNNFEKLARAMIDTTVSLIITLRVCAIIAIIIVTIVIVRQFLKRCNNCVNSCTESSRKPAKDNVYYEWNKIPMKPIIGNKR